MRMKTKSFKVVLLLVIIFGIACRVTILWFYEEVTPTANIGIFDLDINETLSDFQPQSFKLQWHNDIKSTTLLPTTPVNIMTTLSTTSRRKRKKKKSKRRLPSCPEAGENLIGELRVDKTIPNLEDVEKSVKGWLKKGGAWRPRHCRGVKVAIIVPYRRRYIHLKIFLRHIHPILKRQLLDYRIFIMEQNGETPFNRAMLFNIGYNESLKFGNFSCFVFHDVDLLPENDENYYGCPMSPRHLSVAVDIFDYRLPYHNLLGGAAAFSRKDFQKINGFSNRFWGWGGEDDDMYHRITRQNLELTRPSSNKGRYQMLKMFHRSAEGDPQRHEKLLSSQRKMGVDGLNTLKYDVVQTVEHPLYTMITVNVQKNVYNLVR